MTNKLVPVEPTQAMIDAFLEGPENFRDNYLAMIAAAPTAQAERIKDLESRPATEMRYMLQSMQAGEMSVSRGIELLEIWLAGNYRDDMLPPITFMLTEDETPIEKLATANALIASKDALIEQARLAIAAATQLRAALCENGDDETPPTPAINYDKPIQHWTGVLVAIERHQKGEK